jgi:hypothetical protein
VLKIQTQYFLGCALFYRGQTRFYLGAARDFHGNHSELPHSSKEGMSDMLLTGNQLKAARALADLTQAQLAKAAVVDVTTISAMESRKAATLRSGLDTIRAIMTALEAAGVELLAQGPGVRLKGGN